MYEIYKSLMTTMSDFMKDEKAIQFLQVKQIDNDVPDRKSIIKFGLILKEMDQFLKEQLTVEQKIRGKLMTIIKYDKSFSKIINFIQIINNEYNLEFSQQLLDELSHISDITVEDSYSIQDIIYEVLKRIKTSISNDHIKNLLSKEIKHPITYRLIQLNQSSHITQMYQHNEKIVQILIQVCNQDSIPIPQIISCLYLSGDQIKLRIDSNLEKSVLQINQVKKVAEELGYNHQSLAQYGLLEQKLQYYKQYLDVPEQDLIDSALSTLVIKGSEVNQAQIRLLINQVQKSQNSPQLNRLNFLFNQLLETSIQMVEKRQQNKNFKININIVICEAIERMTKEKCGFPQLISMLKIANHTTLKIDTSEQTIRKYYQYLNRAFVDLYNVTSQTQLNNFCKTQLLNQSYQNEIEVFEKMLNLIYSDKSKYLIELKQIFDQPETKTLLMILNIQKDKFSKINEQIQKLQAYSQQKEIIQLDSDDEIKKIIKQ